MASNYQAEELQALLREKLNQDKVKLWLPPYTTDQGDRGNLPEDIIAKYSKELGYPEDAVLGALEELRIHAVGKLAAREKFQQQGIATVKVKLAGNVPKTEKKLPKSIDIEIDLRLNGSQLKEAICKASEIPKEYMKLVSSGRVVEDEVLLCDQNVKNHSTVMVICMTETEAEARRYEDRASKVAKTRAAAEILSTKVVDDGNDNSVHVQIADQTGKPIDLPKEESQALALAMTLNEKGRAALKRKEFGEALLLLLEADKEFKKCRSDILNAVDNYAILCLDIVWCYFRLKNVQDLPDAEERLVACDECFRKSYGPNLERLALVKGGTGAEKALFMRLHLMQGILAFHQYRKDKAIQLLNRAEHELGTLQIDAGSLAAVMAMGFTEQEARVGLRSCEGNVQLAVSNIMHKKEEKATRKENEKEEKRKKRLEKKLGKTANGQWVNTDTYHSLVDMGYGKGASAEALRQGNNDITLALQVLHEHPEFLTLPDPDPPQVNVTDEMLTQVTALGFDLDAARHALRHFHGSVQRAIEELLKHNGAALPHWMSSPNTSSSSEGSTESDESSSGKSSEEQQREREAIESLIPDIPESEEDYLDIDLEDEATILGEYKGLLASMM